MPNLRYTSFEQPPTLPDRPPNTVQTQLPPLNDICRAVFTRQLWQRTMPDEDQSEQDILNKSHTAASQGRNNRTAPSSRRTSSSISLRSRNRSPSPSRGSKTPLTPEESPPFQSTRKRSAGTAEEEDQPLNSTNTSPAHTRANSGEAAVHVCICQPDPKIPRPRNGR
jgi:HMG box factor